MSDMPNRPSDIIALYRHASRAARRDGKKYVLNEHQLGSMFSRAQIDGIYAEIEYIESMERQLEARLAALDALPNGGAV